MLRLAKLPPDEQDRVIADAFEQAREEDFETFEAYSEEPPIELYATFGVTWIIL